MISGLGTCIIPAPSVVGNSALRTFPDVPSFNENRQRKMGQLLRAYAFSNPDVGALDGTRACWDESFLSLVSDTSEGDFYVTKHTKMFQN